MKSPLLFLSLIMVIKVFAHILSEALRLFQNPEDNLCFEIAAMQMNTTCTLTEVRSYLNEATSLGMLLSDSPSNIIGSLVSPSDSLLFS